MMIRLLFLALAGALATVLAAMLWQHTRYVNARRDLAHDTQPLFHSANAFHVITFVQQRPETDLFVQLGELREQIERFPDAQMIYAGKVALNAQTSRQLTAVFGQEVSWDAVTAVQYPSHDIWEQVSASEGYRRALSVFERTYAHGMQRSPWLNLAIPQLLLGIRARQIATRAPSHFPFVPAADQDAVLRRYVVAGTLRSQHELGRDAVVVVNLLERGTPEQRAADSTYTGAMFGLMAEGGHGPMHIGNAVTLEQDTRFDNVALVYYPGVDYFADMVSSTFYQGIFGDKQLADTQASITLPILHLLKAPAR